MKTETKIWPLNPQISALISGVILIILLGAHLLLDYTLDWPHEKAVNTVIIGIFILSLAPIILAVLQVVLERGGKLSYKGLEIDFSKISGLSTAGFNIPANIADKGSPITDSGTVNILNALQKATSTQTVIIDLEDGHAWWETRLLVLLTGASRLGKPENVVFVAAQSGSESRFVGMGKPQELLECLKKAHTYYPHSLAKSKAAAKQLEMIVPADPEFLTGIANVQNYPTWYTDPVVTGSQWMAFDDKTGLPNGLLEEQILQGDLGFQLEENEGPKAISVARLIEIFSPVLYTDHIDLNWGVSKQKEAFFSNDLPWIPLTNKNIYTTIVSRMTIYNELLLPMVKAESV